MNKAFDIDGRNIGPDEPPYVIAELSANHGGNLDRAKRIIQIAADKGADAIKFQAYTADEMTLDCDQDDFVVHADNPWKGEKLYDLYARAATPYEWFPELFSTAHECGITPFASPFGEDSLAMLERLDSPAYKIASFEANDLDLIAACARTNKPTIVSTGLCSFEDIENILEAFHSAGGRDIALLRCNSAYPADPKEAHLATIGDMIERFQIPVGYSDHTLTSTQAIVAIGLGASILEKHVIDARQPETPDSTFSILPDELESLVQLSRSAWEARGSVRYGPQPRERESLAFRRSLYVSGDIKKGERFTDNNVRCVRPGNGLEPKFKGEILGKTATSDLVKGTPLSWDLIQ